MLSRFTCRAGLSACLLEADVRCDVEVDLGAVQDALLAAQVCLCMCEYACVCTHVCVSAHAHAPPFKALNI